LELGLTQAAAAKRFMVNPWTVLNWEIGRTSPPIRSMPAIRSVLGYYPLSSHPLSEWLVRITAVALLILCSNWNAFTISPRPNVNGSDRLVDLLES
jgi:transcriptional regulator with XRE-family HTH domain